MTTTISRLFTLMLSVVIVGLLASSTFAADLIVLADGTILEGNIRRSGGMYRIATTDGQIKFVPAADVITINGKPANQVTPTTPGASGNNPSVPGQSGGAAAAGKTDGFRDAKNRADRVEEPILAVTIWEDFVAKNPANADIELAKEELKLWQTRQKENAEKIRGEWLGGDALKKIKDQADRLYEEAIDRTPRGADSDQLRVRGAVGLRKLEEAIKIYPRHWQSNFEMGFYFLIQSGSTANRNRNLGMIDRAIRALETTRLLAPKVPEVHSNLAYAYASRNRHEQAIMSAYRATKLRESVPLAQVLVNVIENAPASMRQANPRLRPILDDLVVIQRRHNISGASQWIYLYPDPNNPEGVVPPGEEDDNRPPGLQGNGSGFFVSADGYIMTNKHVAEGKPGFFYRVRLDDGTEMNAEFIASDPDQDIALLKVAQRDVPYTFLQIAEDNPNEAAQAMSLGYPATGSRDFTLQINTGSVRSVHPTDKDFHVWFDLRTTHGNSGGPIVDRAGRVIGIASALRQVYNVDYLLAVGPNQMETFINKNTDKAPSLLYAPPPGDEITFNGEKLGKECRKATVLVLIIKGEKPSSDASTTKPSEGQSPPNSGDEGGPGAGGEGKGSPGQGGMTPAE